METVLNKTGITSNAYLIYTLVKPYIQKYQLIEFMYGKNCNYDYVLFQKQKQVQTIVEINSIYQPRLPENKKPLPIIIKPPIIKDDFIITNNMDSEILSITNNIKHKFKKILLVSSTGYNIEFIYNYTFPEYSYVCIDNREVLTKSSLENKNANTLRKLLRLYDVFLHQFDFKVEKPELQDFIYKIKNILTDYDTFIKTIGNPYDWLPNIEKENHSKYTEFIWIHLQILKRIRSS